MTDTITTATAVESLVGMRVGYAEHAIPQYPGCPARNAVGDGLASRLKDGMYEVEVHWWVGYTRWERADTLVAICPSAPINANRGR